MRQWWHSFLISFCVFFMLSFAFSFRFSSWTAPENQLFSNCSILSDMFSLGLVMCTIFNQGHALIQANNSASTYLKQLEAVSLHRYLWKWFTCAVCLSISLHLMAHCFAFSFFISLRLALLCTAIEMNVIIVFANVISSCLIRCKRCFPVCRYPCKRLFHDWPSRSQHHDQPLNCYN